MKYILICCCFYALTTTAQSDTLPNRTSQYNDILRKIRMNNPEIGRPTSSAPPVILPPTQQISILAGTEVVLKTNTRIRTNEIGDGNPVELIVYGNVVVEGVTVIRTNTVAYGISRVYHPPSAKEYGEIVIEPTSVRDVNGQTVALNALNPYRVKFKPNQPTIIHPGKLLMGAIQNNVLIELR